MVWFWYDLKNTFSMSLKYLVKNGNLHVKGTEQKALFRHGHAHKSKASLIFYLILPQIRAIYLPSQIIPVGTSWPEEVSVVCITAETSSGCKFRMLLLPWGIAAWQKFRSLPSSFSLHKLNINFLPGEINKPKYSTDCRVKPPPRFPLL